jgi:hypothetical protein
MGTTIAGRPDPSWRSLYRAGGICAMLNVVAYLTAIVVISVAAPPIRADGAETLTYIAAHRGLYTAEQVLWLAPGVLAMIVFLALAVAVKSVDKGYAAIAGLIGVSSWAITLALPVTGGGSPILVYLSNEYATATSAEQRAAFATVAEGLMAENNTPNLAGVLTTVGILLISLVMLRSAFPRWTAVLGIVTGVIGVVSEVLRPVLGVGYSGYGLLLLVWLAVIGWKLYGLAR